jgi:DNA-binding response OmpR family regulator
MHKILLVEDDRLYQKISSAMLTRANYAVDIAEDGACALDLFKQNQYQAILLDINLPDMQGTQVAQDLRKIELAQGKTHVPIIAVTGCGDDLKQLCLNSGMDDFISKPFKREQLLELLQNIIQEQETSWFDFLLQTISRR